MLKDQRKVTPLRVNDQSSEMKISGAIGVEQMDTIQLGQFKQSKKGHQGDKSGNEDQSGKKDLPTRGEDQLQKEKEKEAKKEKWLRKFGKMGETQLQIYSNSLKLLQNGNFSIEEKNQKRLQYQVFRQLLRSQAEEIQNSPMQYEARQLINEYTPCVLKDSWRQCWICLPIMIHKANRVLKIYDWFNSCQNLPYLQKVLFKILICFPFYLLFTLVQISIDLLAGYFLFFFLPVALLVNICVFVERQKSNCVRVLLILFLPITVLIGLINTLDRIYLQYILTRSGLSNAQGYFKTFFYW